MTSSEKLAYGNVYSENELQLLFDYWWTIVISDKQLLLSVEAPSLAVKSDPENVMTAQIFPYKRSKIEIYNGFLADIWHEIEINKNCILSVCFDNRDFGCEVSRVERVTLACVQEIIISFIILHESFHLLCGHTSLPREGHEDKVSGYSETCDQFILEGPDSITQYATILKAYFFEVEADDTALQYLMRSTRMASLSEFLALSKLPLPQLENFEIADLEGETRVVGFRLLVISLWIIVRLMERKRANILRHHSLTHPMPAARLIAALFTILEQFAELIPLSSSSSDQRSVKLSETQANEARIFFTDILKPVLNASWSEHDQIESQVSVSYPIWIIIDMYNLLFDKPPQTDAGKELNQLEKLRFAMNEQLLPYRYFELGVPK